MHPATRILVWLLMLTGGAALAGALLIPPWLELQALREVHAEAQERLRDLQDRVVRVERQIEHLRSDPAYVERIARDEIGFEPADVDTILIDIDPPPASQPTTLAATGDFAGGIPLAAKVEVAAQSNPLVTMLVVEPHRSRVMIISGATLLAALGILVLSPLHRRGR